MYGEVFVFEFEFEFFEFVISGWEICEGVNGFVFNPGGPFSPTSWLLCCWRCSVQVCLL
jgi:hypothetical protein